jgi:hypothetical protein
MEVQHGSTCLTKTMETAISPAAEMANSKTVSAIRQMGENDGMKGFFMTISVCRFVIVALVNLRNCLRVARMARLDSRNKDLLQRSV